MFKPRFTVPFIFAVALVMVFGSDLTRARADFSKHEQRLLDGGKLVTRYESKALGHLKLVGGTSWQVVDAPPETVWNGFREFHRYKHFLPQCDESRVVKRSPKNVILRLVHSEGPIRAAYHMKVKANETIRAAQFRLSTKYDNDIREGWGFVKITPYKGGKALISYGVMADVGTGILAGAVRASIHQWMLRVPRLFKEDLLRRQKAALKQNATEQNTRRQQGLAKSRR